MHSLSLIYVDYCYRCWFCLVMTYMRTTAALLFSHRKRWAQVMFEQLSISEGLPVREGTMDFDQSTPERGHYFLPGVYFCRNRAINKSHISIQVFLHDSYSTLRNKCIMKTVFEVASLQLNIFVDRGSTLSCKHFQPISSPFHHPLRLTVHFNRLNRKHILLPVTNAHLRNNWVLIWKKS